MFLFRSLLHRNNNLFCEIHILKRKITYHCDICRYFWPVESSFQIFFLKISTFVLDRSHFEQLFRWKFVIYAVGFPIRYWPYGFLPQKILYRLAKKRKQKSSIIVKMEWIRISSLLYQQLLLKRSMKRRLIRQFSFSIQGYV